MQIVPSALLSYVLYFQRVWNAYLVNTISIELALDPDIGATPPWVEMSVKDVN